MKIRSDEDTYLKYNSFRGGNENDENVFHDNEKWTSIKNVTL